MNEEHTLSLEELGKIKTVKVYNQAYVDKQQERIEALEKENAELRDLIKNIIRVTWGEGWNYSLDWKVKAEQFLNSEVGK